ncbi:MAG: hypothetical protein QMD09_02345 [Desulfatibacillaceae bacterium]|nr:hypothetical protein [Desulfatibacillaceae bacterium]
MKSLERIFVKCMTRSWIAGPLVLLLFVAMALGVGWILDSTRVLERHQAVGALYPILPERGPYRLAQGEIPARLELKGTASLKEILTPPAAFALDAGGQSFQARVIEQSALTEGVASIKEQESYLIGISPIREPDLEATVQGLFEQGFLAMEVAVRGEKLWKAAIKKTGL